MGLEIRNPNFKSFKVTAPSAGYTAGEMIKIEDTVGIIVNTVELDEETALIYECEKIVVPKSAGVTFAAGDKVYYNASAKAVTSTASGNTLCGRANEVGESADTTLEISLSGHIAA